MTNRTHTVDTIAATMGLLAIVFMTGALAPVAFQRARESVARSLRMKKSFVISENCACDQILCYHCAVFCVQSEFCELYCLHVKCLFRIFGKFTKYNVFLTFILDKI